MRKTSYAMLRRNSAFHGEHKINEMPVDAEVQRQVDNIGNGQ